MEIPLEKGYLCSPCVPVYLVSTIGKDGIFNVAPYGIVMPVSYKPLMCCIEKFDLLKNLGLIVPYYCTQYKKKILNVFPKTSMRCAVGKIMEI